MKKLCISILFLLVSLPAVAQDRMITVESNYSVGETAERLTTQLMENDINIFERVNHHKGAASVGMEIPETVVIIFGNPALGTPIMQCAPTAAIDLPQKMLVWENQDGKVHIGYNSSDHLKKRHNIEGCGQELQKIDVALEKFAMGAAGQNE